MCAPIGCNKAFFVLGGEREQRWKPFQQPLGRFFFHDSGPISHVPGTGHQRGDRVLFLLSQKGKYRGNTFALECHHTFAGRLYRWLAGPPHLLRLCSAGTMEAKRRRHTPQHPYTCIHPPAFDLNICMHMFYSFHLPFHFLNTQLKMTVRLIYALNLYSAFHSWAVFFFFFSFLTAVIYNCRKYIITFSRVGHPTQTNTLKVILHLLLRAHRFMKEYNLLRQGLMILRWEFKRM